MLFYILFCREISKHKRTIAHIYGKVLYSKLSKKLALKCNIGLRKIENNNGFRLVIITSRVYFCKVILLVTIKPLVIR